jgi:hypothetical protein
LMVAQSSNPSSDGQYAASGSFSYVIGTCSGSVALTGNVSGVGTILMGLSGSPPNLETVSVVATSNQAATTVNMASVSFSPAPCSQSSGTSASYFGTLIRQ